MRRARRGWPLLAAAAVGASIASLPATPVAAQSAPPPPAGSPAPAASTFEVPKATKEKLEENRERVVRLEAAVIQRLEEVDAVESKDPVVALAKESATKAKAAASAAAENAKKAADEGLKATSQTTLDAAVKKSADAVEEALAAKEKADDAHAAALPTLSATLRGVASTRSSLSQLAEEQSEEDRKAAADRQVRLMQFGLSVGVAAMLYVPGFGENNTLDGIAAGAMPYVGMFPAYWRDDEATNLYCALQWSTSERSALASADAVDEQPTESDGQAKEEEGLRLRAEQALVTAERATLDAEAAEERVTEARTKEAEFKTNKAESGLLVAQEKRVADAEQASGEAKRQASAKAIEAKDFAQQYRDALARSSRRSAAKRERGHAKDKKKHADELVEELEAALRGEPKGSVDVDALLGDAERVLATASKSKTPGENQDACVTQVAETLSLLGAATTGDTVALTPEQQKSKAKLACKLAQARRDVVDLEIQVDGFRGQSTNCAAHKFGAFVGYPGVFTGPTLIEERTEENRQERELTPLMSFGFVFAPNALTSLVSGPWLATADVNGTAEFVWGFNVGLGITADVFTALAD